MRSEASTCSRSLAGIEEMNPAGGMDVCLSVCCECFVLEQIDASYDGTSLVQGSNLEWVCVECDSAPE
jgi:hypothetical protein